MKTIYKAQYEQLIKILIDKRKQKQLTQTELALRLGKPQSYIAKIENKDRRLDVIELIELCEAMSTDASEVIKAVQKNE